MSTELNLVIVEDNELLRLEMEDFLRDHGWAVHGVDCGEMLNEWLMFNEPHIAILDINLPFEDGYSIALRLRDAYPLIKIVMLSARVRSIDRTVGYRTGADVYLNKPLYSQELLAVIENLTAKLSRVAVSKYVLDRVGRKLTDGYSVCNLSSLESYVLELLALSPQRTAHREFMAEQIGRRLSREVTTDALSVYLSRLRHKCKVDLSLGNIVVADRGNGYTLTIPLAFSVDAAEL